MKVKHNLLSYCGILMIIAALVLTGYNLWESHQAEESVKQVLQEIDLPSPAQDSTSNQENDSEMPTVTALGNDYIGILEIPCLNMRLPIMDDCDMQKLKIAPGRYQGSIIGNDLIIAGHNYRSHFSSLGRLKGGERVIFTDMDNNRITYEVSLVEELDEHALDEMVSGDWDLSLFTCTLSGTSRWTVRCKRCA